MKTKAIIILITLLTLINSGIARAETRTYFFFSASTPNSRILITSGGLVAIGFTIGYLTIGYIESKRKPAEEPRYASLVTYDTQKGSYDLKAPSIAIDEDSFHVPLFELKF